MSIRDSEIPKLAMPNNNGTFKLVIGNIKGRTSKIKTFTEQFLYHLQLNPDKSFSMAATNAGWEYAAFAVKGDVIINDTELQEGKLMVFGGEGSGIHFKNDTNASIDVLLFFDGEPYTEPIIAQVLL